MYSLMIIDDEDRTINGLKNNFDWKFYDIEIVATANSGTEALEKIYNYKPNIVITDIKMPGMSGLEFAKIIMKDFPDTKLLIISGYDDMEFIRSAFSVNAINYILKPINLTELEDCVEQIIEKIKEDEKKQEQQLEMQMQLFHSMPLLRKNFFNKLIFGNISENDVDKQLKFLNLDFDIEANYFAVIASIDDYKKTFSYRQERDKDNIIFSIMNISEELLSNVCKTYVFENAPDKVIFILQADNEKVFINILQDIQTKAMDILSVSLTIGIGENVNGIINISKSYFDALNAVNKRFVLGKNQIISTKNFVNAEATHIFDLYELKNDNLLNALKATDKEKIQGIFTNVFKQLKANGLLSLTKTQYIYHQLVLIATIFSIEHMCFSESIQKLRDSVIDSLENFETLDEMHDCIINYYFTICDAYSKVESNSFSNLIIEIQNIIKKRYFENLTITDIATAVFLTPTYICRLFKQETGITINEYLTKTRIEISKKMIADKSNKITDIGYLVGYADSSYFTKQFKKLTGFTPKEYRDTIKDE